MDADAAHREFAISRRRHVVPVVHLDQFAAGGKAVKRSFYSVAIFAMHAQIAEEMLQAGAAAPLLQNVFEQRRVGHLLDYYYRRPTARASCSSILM
jgi:hypothetical protein